MSKTIIKRNLYIKKTLVTHTYRWCRNTKNLFTNNISLSKIVKEKYGEVEEDELDVKGSYKTKFLILVN